MSGIKQFTKFLFWPKPSNKPKNSWKWPTTPFPFNRIDVDCLIFYYPKLTHAKQKDCQIKFRLVPKIPWLIVVECTGIGCSKPAMVVCRFYQNFPFSNRSKLGISSSYFGPFKLQSDLCLLRFLTVWEIHQWEVWLNFFMWFSITCEIFGLRWVYQYDPYLMGFPLIYNLLSLDVIWLIFHFWTN